MEGLPKKETLQIEFKSDTKERNGLPDHELIDTVVGMANSKGGSIFLGIEDDGKVTGAMGKHLDETGVCALIANSTVPSVQTKAEILDVEENTKIIRIDVPMSRTVVASSAGKTLRRRLKLDGSPETVPLFPYEIQSRLSELSLLDFSATPLAGSSMADLDPLEQVRLRSIIENNPSGDKKLLELTDEELNLSLRLVTRQNDSLVPTMAGMLLLGKEPSIQRLAPTARSSFQVLEGTNVRINESFNAPLLKTFETFSTYLNAWNPEKETSYGLFRISIPEFNRDAFREGLVNAFSHRDYTQLGEVRVLITDEGLSISSQGGFIDGVNTDNLISVEPHGRNPALADALKRIGLAERTGRGIDRIYEGSMKYGRPWPDYSESTSSVVRLFIQRAEPDVAFINMIATEQNRMGKPLSLNALMALSLIRNEGRASRERICRDLHISEQRASATIAQLLGLELIEEGGSDRNPLFSLNPVFYRRIANDNVYGTRRKVSVDDYQQAIVELARRNGGFVTKDEVSSVLDISGSQAYFQIKKLVKDRTLTPNQRGKYANYRLEELTD